MLKHRTRTRTRTDRDQRSSSAKRCRFPVPIPQQSMRKITRAAIGAIAISVATGFTAIAPASLPSCTRRTRRVITTGRARTLHHAGGADVDETTTATAGSDDVRPDIDGMRLREIKDELNDMKISFDDCFDRDSLVVRLREARDGLVEPLEVESAAAETVDVLETTEKDTDTTTSSVSVSKDSIDEEEFDREATLSELRGLRIKELKIRLTELGIRWGTFIEKEDMVQAVLGALELKFELARNFSRSGDITPSTVTDVDEATLIKELGWREKDVNRGVITAAAESSSQVHPPILLDAYATWCGPCQMVAPFLKAASEELGSGMLFQLLLCSPSPKTGLISDRIHQSVE